MKLVAEVKTHSSKWVKSKGEEYKNFYWQGGYGAFSVGANRIENLIAYIANQHDHHGSKTFQDEFRNELEKNNIVYDERYVWD